MNGDLQIVLLSLDGRYLYVTQPTLGRVDIISARTGKTICSASLPDQPTLLALGPENGALYAAGNGSSTVSALDPTTCAVQRTIDTQSPVYGLAVGLVGASNNLHDQLWVSGTTSLTILDQNGQQLGSIPVLGGPQYISQQGGNTIYVTTRQGGVDAVDLGTRQVIPLLKGRKFGPMDYDAVPVRSTPQTSKTGRLMCSHRWLREPNHISRLNGAPQSVAITSDGQLGFVALSGVRL